MSMKLEDNKNNATENRLTTKKDRVVSPNVNVYENDKEALFLIDIPGVSEDSLEISLEKGCLQVEGRVKIPVMPEYKKEFNEAQVDVFRRRFNLGKSVESDLAVAKLLNGQLRLTLPKSDPVKKKIQITNGL